MINQVLKYKCPENRSHMLAKECNETLEHRVSLIQQEISVADRRNVAIKSVLCKVITVSNHLTEYKKRVADLEVEVRKLTEEDVVKEEELKSCKLLNHEKIEKYRNQEVDQMKFKCKKGAEAATEWKNTIDKLKKRLDSAEKYGNNARKMMEEYGIRLFSDENGFSGIGLCNLDPKLPEFEGVVYLKDLTSDDWSFSEVLSVDPPFPEAKKYLQEANAKKDFFHVLSLAREYWIHYFDHESSFDVSVSSYSESIILDDSIKSGSGSATSSLLFGDYV